jgi:hypothetical protein
MRRTAAIAAFTADADLAWDRGVLFGGWRLTG